MSNGRGSGHNAKYPYPKTLGCGYKYIEETRGREEGTLFLSRYEERLTSKAIRLIAQRLARQASTHLGKHEKIKLTPHMLRHTFLKRVADKHGVHYAQEASGNVSSQVIFRYTKPSEAELERTAEELFYWGPTEEPLLGAYLLLTSTRL